MKRTLKCLNRAVCLIISSNLLLVGCNSLSPPPAAPGEKIPLKTRQTKLSDIHSWNLAGKIGVQTAKDSGSASVTWQQAGGAYSMSVIGPMGSGGMTLKGRPGSVTLTTNDGKHYTAASPEGLLSQHWGYNIPVSYMNYWIRGLPAPSRPAKTKYDQYNRLTRLYQAGWNVQYLGFSKTAMGDLPNSMTITSPNMRVKIVVNSWHVA